ncbi:DNA-directed RNA polymerase I subunit RPA34.5 [Ceratocystis platani]|uniref:DNA-directed RNA polymerase I subunit RPA34.5 n=1 Tax=Ceratocystis fimbriata f. sp. platani TaxID=88771 RepID=A0A0F8B7E0_CERFI|nr:DNA-directed RNA polymerase I subunit RPA34.5 [Ceratocystis platani]
MGGSTAVKSGSSKKAAKDQVKSILGSRHAKNSDSDSSSSSSESESESDGESTLMKQISTPKKMTKTELPSRLKKEDITESAKKRVSINDTLLGGSKSKPGSVTKPTKSNLKSEPAHFKSSDTVDSSEDSSSESDSDSSSESEVETKKPVAKPTPAPIKQKAETKKVAPPSKSAVAPKSAATVETSSSESESESESEDGDEDVEMDDVDQQPTSSNELSEKDLKAASAPPDTLNSDFMLRKAVGNADSEKLARLFSEATSSGKQLWYFTAPADVPITLVESMEIPLDQAMAGGEASFKHQGEDFAVEVDQVASNRNMALMIPSGPSDDKYNCDVRRANAVFSLRRVAPTSAISNITITATKKTYRPQPRGMKMRFRPIGVPADADMGRMTYDDSDDESVAAPSPKKRKHKETMADDQSKKKRKDKSSSDSKKERKEKKEKKSKDQVLPPPRDVLLTPRKLTSSTNPTVALPPHAASRLTPRAREESSVKAHEAEECASSDRTPSSQILAESKAAYEAEKAQCPLKEELKAPGHWKSQEQKSAEEMNSKQLSLERALFNLQKKLDMYKKKAGDAPSTPSFSPSPPPLSRHATATTTAATKTIGPSTPPWSNNNNSNQPTSTATLNTRPSLQTPVPAPKVQAKTATATSTAPTTATSSAALARLISESPVPVPVFGRGVRETPIPLPKIPGLVVPATIEASAPAAASAAATPTPKEKTSRKKKTAKGTVTTPAASKAPAAGAKAMTPVPPPKIPSL